MGCYCALAPLGREQRKRLSNRGWVRGLSPYTVAGVPLTQPSTLNFQ